MEKLYSCYVCKGRFPREKFPRNRARDTGLSSRCLECNRGHDYEARRVQRGYKRRNKRHEIGVGVPESNATISNAEKYLRGRSYNLWRNFKMTLDDYQTILDAQGGVCAICEGPPNGAGAQFGNFHVDHDSTENRVRGLLCSNCNHAIGKLKHDRDNLARAIAYLDGGFWDF
jgi:hypothetical protein